MMRRSRVGNRIACRRPVEIGKILLFAGCWLAAPLPAADDGLVGRWWEGRHLTGEWLGARDTLGARGIKLGGSYKLAYFGVVDSRNGSGGFYGQDIVFNAGTDFAKLLGWGGIDGLEGFVEGRWRENRPDVGNPNELVGAGSMFNPSPWWSGTGWRMVQFGLKYKSPAMFGVDDFLTLKGGWLRPQREFLDQPLSKLFLNNAINSAKGVGGNVPFSSSFSTWGGTAQVKAAAWQYTKLGLFMAYPEAIFSGNHGLMFAGYAPDPAANRLYFLGETGFTPEIGASKLDGRYAFGAYVGGASAADGGNRYGFYWQADQMVWREQGDEGLRAFSLVTVAPSYNNRYPFYTQGGLAYRGLVPGRGRDTLYAGFGMGTYSDADGTYTVVIEGGYRFRLNGWSSFSPYCQYLSRPDGTSEVANAVVMGLQFGMDF